jgi:hypothetical protein
MACSKMLSFASIVQGRDSSVRITDDGFFDVVDTVMVVTGKNCNHSNELLRNLKSSLFDNEKIVMRNGRRYAAPKDIITLIMVLPGKIAKEIRSQFAAIIEDYMQKHAVIDEEGTVRIPAPSACDAPGKKRQLQMEEFEMQIVMDERKQQLSMMVSEAQMKAADAQMKVMGVQKMLMDTYALLCPNQVMDDRARLLFKDNILNIATQSTPARGQLAIEDGGVGGVSGASGVPAGVSPNKPITISTLAVGMGYRFDNGQLQKIGKKAAAAFREKYGESPPKHEQLVGQASIMVNSYTEKDRGLLESVIVDFINE